MKQAGWIAIVVAVIMFVVAIATAFGNIGDVAQDLSGLQPRFPWQLQVAIEGLIGFAFFIPGVALVTRK